jgi:hypothetical protein
VKRALAIALAVAAALAVAGCATRPDTLYRSQAAVRAPVIPPQGLLYTRLRAPLSLEAVGFGAKRGTAVSHQLALPPLPFPGLWTGLDLFAWGDASLRAAAENGGIREVQGADYELMVVLLVYRRFTSEVYGN